MQACIFQFLQIRLILFNHQRSGADLSPVKIKDFPSHWDFTFWTSFLYQVQSGTPYISWRDLKSGRLIISLQEYPTPSGMLSFYRSQIKRKKEDNNADIYLLELLNHHFPVLTMFRISGEILIFPYTTAFPQTQR